MAVEKILNDVEFFADIADTPKEDVEQHRKQECLKQAISKAKVYLLSGKKKKKKLNHKRLDKASNKTINKTYA